MTLPAAVQKQVDEANRLVDEMRKSQAANSAPTPAPAANEPAPAPTDQATPPAPAPAPVAAVAPAPAPTPAQPIEDWEHKFKVLQGKYNAEVPRLHRANSELQNRVQSLEAMLATLNRQPEPSPVTPAAPVSQLKPEEISEWGPDLYDFVKKAAAEVAEAKVNEVKQEVRNSYGKVEKTVSTVQQVVQQSARDRLLSELTAQVPNWETLDSDAGFLGWLETVDVYSGQPRRVLLRQAYTANDAPRVIAFFKAYLNENAAVSPRVAPAAAPAPVAAPQVTLEEMVAPGTPKAGAAGAPNGGEKRIWSQAEINDHFRKVQKGLFRGREKEQRSIELDIVAAGREGRLRP